MFGKNPLRKQELRSDGELWIQEIFATIQGEGPFAGIPAIFVRLAGCNLRCWFCDTDFETGTLHLSVFDALEMIEEKKAKRPIDLIVLTGGEPLRQNIVPLIHGLISDHRVQIETAGTVWVPSLDEFIRAGDDLTIVCSPKTPKVNPMIEEHCEHYKYIISADTPIDVLTGIPLADTQRSEAEPRARLYLPEDFVPYIWLQPCDEQDAAKNQRNLQLCVSLAMRHGYRISLQQHKILGVE